jgi:hypothetical protein
MHLPRAGAGPGKPAPVATAVARRLVACGQALLQPPGSQLPTHGEKERPSGLYLEQCLRLALPSDCRDPAQVLTFLKKAGIELVVEGTLRLASEEVRGPSLGPSSSPLVAACVIL